MSNDRRRLLNRDSVIRHTVTVASMLVAAVVAWTQLEAQADQNTKGVEANKEAIAQVDTKLDQFDTRLDAIERTQAGIKSKVDTEALRQQEYRQGTKGTLTRILNKLDRSPR